MRNLSLALILLGLHSFGQQAGSTTVRRSPVISDTGGAVVQIDQSRALAGGVTPGDNPGFPVTISQPGSYRLTGNLSIPDLNTTGIQITADFVTLDLNGFGIIGPAVCGTLSATLCPPAGLGIGIQAAPPSGVGQSASPRGVRIRNGSVTGMGQIGILLGGDGSFVERVMADSNVGGGMSVAGAVIESVATQNGSFGIDADIVKDSIVSGNAGDGIILGVLRGIGGVATGNVSSVNGGYGIALQPGTATANTVFFNKAAGISALCPSNIVGNTIIADGPAGIETTGDGCAVANNAVR